MDLKSMNLKRSLRPAVVNGEVEKDYSTFVPKSKQGRWILMMMVYSGHLLRHGK